MSGINNENLENTQKSIQIWQLVREAVKNVLADFVR